MSHPILPGRVVPPSFTLEEAQSQDDRVVAPTLSPSQNMAEVFPVIAPPGAQPASLPGSTMNLSDKVTTLPPFDHPSVKCGTCVWSLILKTPFMGNRRADGRTFEKSVGFCTFFKAEPLALEDIRPTSCNRYSSEEKTHGG